jgi:hypothetical protein
MRKKNLIISFFSLAIVTNILGQNTLKVQKDAYLLTEEDTTSEVIKIIPKGSEVIISEYEINTEKPDGSMQPDPSGKPVS